DEVAGDPDHVNGAEDHDHAVDSRRGPARNFQSKCEQGEARRVDVEHGAADQAPIATSANSTRYHVGRRVVSAPIGSAPIAWFSFWSDAARSSPYTTSNTGATAAPNVVHATTPALDAERGRYRE